MGGVHDGVLLGLCSQYRDQNGLHDSIMLNERTESRIYGFWFRRSRVGLLSRFCFFPVTREPRACPPRIC